MSPGLFGLKTKQPRKPNQELWKVFQATGEYFSFSGDSQQGLGICEHFSRLGPPFLHKAKEAESPMTSNPGAFPTSSTGPIMTTKI